MGLREQLCVLIALLAVGSCVADYESNGKNLSWIYDIKNSATTQNQTYRLDTETGAFRYHFDVSAVDSYKFETNTKEAVTFGCYGWKDLDNRWHGMNYVADSHGRRNVRDITKPVEVFPKENEPVSRTFLENLPQCLAFIIDSPPLMMFVYTNHPPTQKPPKNLESHDNVPHSSEQVHQVHKGRVPAYSGNEAHQPVGTNSKNVGGERIGKGPEVSPGKTKLAVNTPSLSLPPKEDLIAEVTSLAPTLTKAPQSTGYKAIPGLPSAVITSGKDLLQTDTITPLSIDLSVVQTGSVTNLGSSIVPGSDFKTVASTGVPTIAVTGGLDLSKGGPTGSLEFGKGPSSIGSFQVTTSGSGNGVDLSKGSATGSLDLSKVSGPSSIGSFQVTSSGSGSGLDLSKGIPAGSLELGKVSGSIPSSVGSFQVTSSGSGSGLDLSKGIPAGSLELGKVSGSIPSSIGSFQVTTSGSGSSLDLSKGSPTGSLEIGKVSDPASIGAPLVTGGSQGSSQEQTLLNKPSDSIPESDKGITSNLFGIDPSKWGITSTLKSMVDAVVSAGQKIFGMSEESGAKVETGLPSLGTVSGPKLKLPSGSEISKETGIKTGVFTFTPGVGTGLDSSNGVEITSSTIDLPIHLGTGNTGYKYKVDVPAQTSQITQISKSSSTTGLPGVENYPGFKIIEATQRPLPTLADVTQDSTPSFLNSLVSLKTALLNKFGINTGASLSTGSPGTLSGTSQKTASTKPYEGTTSSPVSELHIDVTDFIPTSSSRPAIGKPGASVTTSGVSVSSSTTSGSSTGLPVGTTLFEAPQGIDLTDISNSISKFGDRLKSPSGGPLSQPGSTTTTIGISSQKVTPGFGISVGTDQDPGVSVPGSADDVGVSQGPTVTTVGEFVTSRPGTVSTSRLPGTNGLDITLPGISGGPIVTTIGEFVSSRPNGFTSPQPGSLLEVSPYQAPSSTPSTFGSTFDYSSKPAEFGPLGFGPTTPSNDLSRTATVKYLPPETGEGPMCSCVCPRN